MEWIVERPSVNDDDGKFLYLAMLPDFVVRYFDECATGIVPTGGGTGTWEDLEFAQWVTMTNADGDVLSEPTVENDVLLKVSWVKSS